MSCTSSVTLQRVRFVSPFVGAMPWYYNDATFTVTACAIVPNATLRMHTNSHYQITNSLPAHGTSIFVVNYIKCPSYSVGVEELPLVSHFLRPLCFLQWTSISSMPPLNCR